ncbi:MAG: CDP-alcohol phosphatidyltransferase family protein [Alphaproteobacteria bacterium]|jgi:CDP-diacylglycerol--glycerol-3-phosphate 3-phosphatidyltransferase|nr:CDP-alcohol phosphatidyltransferase family protein [Alphaproteobacteria bacterium]
MKFFVNFLSAFRIAAAFAIIPTLMLNMYWTTFILYVLGAASDWFDGFLARKYNVCTKIGGVMDHIGDKLLVVNTFIMLAIMMPVWFVIVPIIIMIARELYISGLREFLGTQKIEMPVPKARFSMGKIKTTLQMISIAAFLLIFVVGTLITPESDSRTLMYLIYILPQIGIWGLWISLVASIWSATQYTITFLGHLKKIK